MPLIWAKFVNLSYRIDFGIIILINTIIVIKSRVTLSTGQIHLFLILISHIIFTNSIFIITILIIVPNSIIIITNNTTSKRGVSESV